MGAKTQAAYGYYTDAMQRLDYFLIGIATALFAYVSQAYQPQKLDLSMGTLEPAGLVFFLLSIISGVKRVRRVQDLYMFLAGREQAQESQENLSENKRDGLIFREMYTGAIFNRGHLVQKQRELRLESEVLEELMEKQSKSAGFYARLRDRFLIAGFFCILAARILSPYL